MNNVKLKLLRQLNQALAGRQWLHPRGVAEAPGARQEISRERGDDRAQIDDNSSPGGYYRPFRDIRECLPKNVILSAWHS